MQKDYNQILSDVFGYTAGHAELEIESITYSQFASVRITAGTSTTLKLAADAWSACS